jgi:hypothetical protein
MDLAGLAQLNARFAAEGVTVLTDAGDEVPMVASAASVWLTPAQAAAAVPGNPGARVAPGLNPNRVSVLFVVANMAPGSAWHPSRIAIAPFNNRLLFDRDAGRFSSWYVN